MNYKLLNMYIAKIRNKALPISVSFLAEVSTTVKFQSVEQGAETGLPVYLDQYWLDHP